MCMFNQKESMKSHGWYYYKIFICVYIWKILGIYLHFELGFIFLWLFKLLKTLTCIFSCCHWWKLCELSISCILVSFKYSFPNHLPGLYAGHLWCHCNDSWQTHGFSGLLPLGKVQGLGHLCLTENRAVIFCVSVLCNCY